VKTLIITTLIIGLTGPAAAVSWIENWDMPNVPKPTQREQQPDVELLLGNGAFCDTPDQIEYVITFASGGTQGLVRVINEVNMKLGKAVCAYGGVAYEKREALSQVSGGDGHTYMVAKIVVYGYWNGRDNKWVKLDKPDEQYTVFNVDEGEKT
jgi:hypothetical protein